MASNMRVHPRRHNSSSSIEAENGGNGEESGETEMRRRFERYSEFNLAPLHGSTRQGENLVPGEDELKSVPEERRALYYFQWLDERQDIDINRSFLETLLKKADINAQDAVSGYTMLHYISSQWDVTVASYVIDCGADVTRTDTVGRTPAHNAAYSNHVDLLKLLLEHGADMSCKTKELQNLVHYAVRGTAMGTLVLLLDREAVYDGKECRDYFGRTPLQLAAELDRSEVVEYLLSRDINPAQCAVIDDNGHSALVTMIHLMPKMAELALDQLHKIFPSKRRQEYLLSRLESQAHTTESPFEAAVEVEAYSVLTHPVMRKLIEEKWRKLARWHFLLYFVLYLLFLVVWTVVIVYPPIQQKHIFNFPTDIWRVVLEVMALVLLFREVADEVIEQKSSYKRNRRYKDSQCRKLLADIEKCGSISLFQEDKRFMEQHYTNIRRSRIKYFNNLWNYVDIVTFAFLLLVSLLHIADVAAHTERLALWTARIACVAVVLIWVRILKYCRAFGFLGPLISIIGQVGINVVQYFIIFLIFYLPFIVNFWLMFGGDQQQQANITDPSEELTSLHRVAVVLFRMTVVDDYPYQAIRDIDELMGTLLVISYLLITAIIGLNLFIALLSDTFQRIYDNAQANAELQKARLILSLDAKTDRKKYRQFLTYIASECSPASDHYDDDDDDSERGMAKSSVQKITHQTHALVNELLEKYDDSNSQPSPVEQRLQSLATKVDSISTQLNEIKLILGAGSPGASGATLLPLADHGTQLQPQEPPPSLKLSDYASSAAAMSDMAAAAKKTARQRHFKKLIATPAAGDHVYQGHRRLKQSAQTIMALGQGNTNDNNNKDYII